MFLSFYKNFILKNYYLLNYYVTILNMKINKYIKLDNLNNNNNNLIKYIPLKFKIIFFILVILIIVITIFLINKVIQIKKIMQKYELYDGTNLDEEKYPGYKELIDNLQASHPNWTFTLFYTKLDWEEVIANEGHSDTRKKPLNLIPDSSKYPDDWRCEIDKEKRFDNGTWLCASDKAIKYQMDPRNILNDDNIFQFAELKYTEGAQTVEGIKSLTENSFLAGDSIAEALLQAGKNANLDTLYLQKFDVVKQDNILYTHQYMQNLLASKSEASNMKKIYEASVTVDTNLNFIIPLDENMPEEVSEY